MKIKYILSDETVVYAASELSKYIKSITCNTIQPEIEKTNSITREDGVFVLALLPELNLPDDDVKDKLIDDVLDIDIHGLSGYIAGSNTRSILIGVYKYLRSVGCRWVRPGLDGEFIPTGDITAHSCRYRKKADYPFRGECIEGAVSYEHVRDTIIWMPKVGYNLFMLEQIVPYNYMSRWYNHEGNVVRKPEPISFEKTAEFILLLEKEIKKCGLQLHAMGHGYIFEPYGIHYKTFADKYNPSEEALSHMALIDGKRELYHGSPNFTHLCYSNPDARRKLVEFCLEYVERKPYIDFLHVWLADSSNNQCECAECRKMRPSDFYVMLLNEIDAEFTKRNISTRIVFILYVDLFWSPEQIEFINQSRFTLMMASTRSYNKPYSCEVNTDPLPLYKRNEYDLPNSFSLNLAFCNEWKKHFAGPSFLYEYYFHLDHYNDPGYFEIAKIILQDVRTLEKLGFSGMISDQTQRSFFPTGFPMSLLGEALFDQKIDFETFAEDYFKSAFGTDSGPCLAYLSGLSALFDPESLRDENWSIVEEDTDSGKHHGKRISAWKDNPRAADRFAKISGYVDAFLPIVERNLNTKNLCHAQSWKYLKIHAEMVKGMAAMFFECASGRHDDARDHYAQLIRYLSGVEEEIQSVFDLCLFRNLMNVKMD